MVLLKELMDLSGRVVLLSGGGGKIGRAIALALAELGASIVLTDRDETGIEHTLQRISENFSTPSVGFAVDMEDETAVRTLPGQVAKHFGHLDILINNAAFVGTDQLQGWIAPFEEQSADTWRRAIEVNLSAVFVLTQSCKSLLEASGHGSIVNIGSTYGMLGPDMSLYRDTAMGNPAAYAASKGGLIQLTRWLATVLAPKIRVNCISPGGVFRNQPTAFVERYIARTPLGRMAVEEDCMGVIAFLASDMSAYVTGQNILVDGGWSAW